MLNRVDLTNKTFNWLTAVRYDPSVGKWECRCTCGNTTLVYNGVDRVDNSRGYESDNVVPCCGACNWMKGTNTQRDFIDHIRRIHQHMKGD